MKTNIFFFFFFKVSLKRIQVILATPLPQKRGGGGGCHFLLLWLCVRSTSAHTASWCLELFAAKALYVARYFPCDNFCVCTSELALSDCLVLCIPVVLGEIH